MLLFFFPVYFTSNGIYKITDSFSRGAVFPFTVILGIYSLTSIIFNNIKTDKIKMKSKIFPMILFMAYGMIVHFLIGYILYKDTISILLNLQYMSGLLGVFIAAYFIKYRKMEIKEIFFYISLVFLLAIISNLIISILNVGIMQTFSRNIYSATILGGIHQKYIYYPFIVAMVFLFALPIWEEKNKFMPLVYLLITIYIIIFQVRGAILSYIIGLVTYFLFFSRRNRLINMLGIIVSIVIITSFIPKEIIIGRFADKSSSVISGREKVWANYGDNFLNDPLYIVRGSYSKSSTLQSHGRDPFEQGMQSYHNQYIEIMDSYGIIIFMLFIFILLYYLKICIKRLRYIADNRNYNYYWITLVIYHLIIDLNVNVPIRVTNPAIMYLFYWTILYLSVQDKANVYGTKEL